jgi:hypothetical protein
MLLLCFIFRSIQNSFIIQFLNGFKYSFFPWEMPTGEGAEDISLFSGAEPYCSHGSICKCITKTCTYPHAHNSIGVLLSVHLSQFGAKLLFTSGVAG